MGTRNCYTAIAAAVLERLEEESLYRRWAGGGARLLLSRARHSRSLALGVALFHARERAREAPLVGI